MLWCNKSKTYQVQKLEKTHQVSLSNGKRFFTKLFTKEVKGNTKSVTPSSSWSSANSASSLLRKNKQK